MSRLKCVFVGRDYKEFYTVGKVYSVDGHDCVSDNYSEGDEWSSWILEDDGQTVLSSNGDENSNIVAEFETLEV